jgi:CMP-N-acetylneuraminic acid synthetase
MYNSKKIVAFSPVRFNSKRTPKKNLKLLGDKPLCRYIFETLLDIDYLDGVFGFSSDPVLEDILPKGATFLKRPACLDNDNTLGISIYRDFVDKVDADLYILAHTTSPFLKSSSIKNAIDMVAGGQYDSAASVEKHQTFIWFDGKPLNFTPLNRQKTQDLKPIYIETSGFYIFTKEQIEKGRRLGDNPYFQVLSSIENIDIDYPDDFDFAEKILKTL